MLPLRGNRNAAIETVVYKTDRNNALREPLDHVTYVQPDWDIDRTGSKARIEIETSRAVLEDYMWVAPYQIITPEVGEIIEQQLGHFRLDRPGMVTDGMDDFTGEPRIVQSTTGADIVDDIVSANLSETFYTPYDGLVMKDIKNLIKMATCGVMGPNIVLNNSFELEGANWSSVFFNGGSGSISYSIQSQGWGTPDGTKVMRAIFNGPVAAASTHTATSAYVSIPTGAQYLYASALVRPGASTGIGWELTMRFTDTAGTEVGSATSMSSYTRRNTWGWQREFFVAPVPDGATKVRAEITTRDRDGRSASYSQCYDDVRIGTCTQMPLPDSRINLPASTARATTRIQTTVGNSIGYDAINADRLSKSLGYHALFTDLEGRLTSAPLRDASSGTAARTYRLSDYRMVGSVETERSAQRPYNHFQAIKEDFTGSGVTLYANAYNNDADDARSIYNAPLTSAPVIMAQDAVDQAALQAMANAARDRSSEQESLRIRVRPDRALQVHDVIEIAESDNPAALGRWLIEYIRPGMRHDDPLVELVCRRTRQQEV